MTLIFPVAMPKKVQPASVFGERLAALRKARGLTQRQLAEARRLRKKFRRVMTLPEKDRRAVLRLVNSLVETKGRAAAGGSR